jgi:TatD DNase family protein
VLVDTHAHLNAPEFAGDVPALLFRGAAAGVEQVICVGYDVTTCERAIELAEEDARIFATVGIHPNYIAEAPNGWEKVISRLAQHPRVVAIGETGLDYYREFTPRDAQAQAFAWHLVLADEMGLPAVVHNRDSDADVEAALREWAARRRSPGTPAVLHSFSGGAGMMRACVEAGCAISFSGMVTFSNQSLAHLAEVVREAPPDAMLLETDCPYLAPAPFRGQRNEPAFVRAVAERVAMLRSMTVEEVERLTTANARRVFPGLGKVPSPLEPRGQRRHPPPQPSPSEGASSVGRA